MLNFWSLTTTDDAAEFVLDMYMGNPLFQEWLPLSQIGNSSHLMSPEMAEWTQDDPWWFKMKLLDSTKDIYLKAKDAISNHSQWRWINTTNSTNPNVETIMRILTTPPQKKKKEAKATPSKTYWIVRFENMLNTTSTKKHPLPSHLGAGDPISSWSCGPANSGAQGDGGWVRSTSQKNDGFFEMTKLFILFFPICFLFKRFRCFWNLEAQLKNCRSLFIACQNRTKSRAKYCRMKATYSTRRENSAKSKKRTANWEENLRGCKKKHMRWKAKKNNAKVLFAPIFKIWSFPIVV